MHTPKRYIKLVFSICGALFFIFMQWPLAAQTFKVNVSYDSIDINPGNGSCADSSGKCSLRAAIQETNNLPGADTIILQESTYQLSIPKATVSSVTDGDLDITDDLSILGKGREVTIIDAGKVDRVFNLYSTSSAVPVITIQSLTIQNGRTKSAIEASAYGGGIYMHESSILNLSDCIVTDNSGGQGGGIGLLTWNITNPVELNMDNCEVSNNTGGAWGGGIYIFIGGKANISNSLISGNTAGSGGGFGYSIGGEASFINTTISNNKANTGGGIAAFLNVRVVKLINSTISGNKATLAGGAIYSDFSIEEMKIMNSTITNNSAGVSGQGGGIQYNGEVNVRNSIVAGNIDPGGFAPDCNANIISGGYNIIGSNNGCSLTASNGDIIGTNSEPVNPLLAPLADNGGLTPTHALLTGSPAINMGNPAVPGTGGVSCESEDQRQISRMANGVCDIGSYEYISNKAPVILTAGNITYLPDQRLTSLLPDLIITDPDDILLTGAIVQFQNGYIPGEDKLTIESNSSIYTDWDSDSGVLTITGVDTLINYQSALQNVMYENTSGEPDSSPRNLDVTVSDSVQTSVPALISLTVPVVDVVDDEPDTSQDSNGFTNLSESSDYVIDVAQSQQNMDLVNMFSKSEVTANSINEKSTDSGLDSLSDWVFLESLYASNEWLNNLRNEPLLSIGNVAIGVTILFFAGLLNILLKVGSLIGLLFSFPLWTTFDPLPIFSLASVERKRREEDAKKSLQIEDADGRVAALLDNAQPDIQDVDEKDKME